MENIKEGFDLSDRIVSGLIDKTPAEHAGNESAYALGILSSMFGEFLFDACSISDAVLSGNTAKAKYLAERIKNTIDSYNG